MLELMLATSPEPFAHHHLFVLQLMFAWAMVELEWQDLCVLSWKAYMHAGDQASVKGGLKIYGVPYRATSA